MQSSSPVQVMDGAFHTINFPKKIYTTEAAMDGKIPFYALGLRNISRLVKTKTKTRAQCLMVNTGSLKRAFYVLWIANPSRHCLVKYSRDMTSVCSALTTTLRQLIILQILIDPHQLQKQNVTPAPGIMEQERSCTIRDISLYKFPE